MRSFTRFVIGTTLVAGVPLLVLPGLLGLSRLTHEPTPVDKPSLIASTSDRLSPPSSPDQMRLPVAEQNDQQRLQQASILAADTGNPVDLAMGTENVTLVPSDPAPISGGLCKSVEVRTLKGGPYDVLTLCNRGDGWRQSDSSANR